jgi:hypothetical protein
MLAVQVYTLIWSENQDSNTAASVVEINYSVFYGDTYERTADTIDPCHDSHRSVLFCWCLQQREHTKKEVKMD